MHKSVFILFLSLISVFSYKVFILYEQMMGSGVSINQFGSQELPLYLLLYVLNCQTLRL